MTTLEKAWRWFGPNDTVRLGDLQQMGIKAVVTSLYDRPAGELWQPRDIKALDNMIKDAGMQWRVVESLPVAEGIKQHTSDYDRLVTHYIESVKNLADNGTKLICYNFMPAIDWLRTDLDYTLPSGGVVMNFDFVKFIAFDMFILRRSYAERDYESAQIEQAERLYEKLSKSEREELAFNIIVKTQAFIHGADYKQSDYKTAFLNRLEAYHAIDKNILRQNLITFLNDIISNTRHLGVRFALHPDDPPFPVLGLPRIVSTFDDLQWIFEQIPDQANGLTFCSGSLSARKDNPLGDMAKAFADRIYFAHLRNNTVSENGNFHETGHFEGDADLSELIYVLLQEQNKRKRVGPFARIPVRPDHGVQMLDDFNRNSPPGYPLIGRFRGLMEIKGAEAGILYMLKNKPNE